MSEEILTVEEPTLTQTTEEIIDLEPFQTNGQIPTKAFWYRVSNKSVSQYLTILAPSSTVARDGIKQQFPDSVVSYMGTSDMIMQVNG